jgi:hypothetical protein
VSRIVSKLCGSCRHIPTRRIRQTKRVNKRIYREGEAGCDDFLLTENPHHDKGLEST